MKTEAAEQVQERIDALEKMGTTIEATYNDYLLEKIEQMFNKEEKDAFLAASDKKRPATIRVNTLLDKRNGVLQKLTNRGVNIEPIKWNDCGAVVYNSEVPIGATPEYLAGMYMLQSPSSMLAVMALAPQANECVVDMCAAPGGKSTHIAAMMENTGVLYANDISKERMYALAANMQRMGVKNAICTHMNAKDLPYTNVDKVLLDAPCSGTGVISKDPSVKRTKSHEEIKKLGMKQRELILKAFDMLNGKKQDTSVMVYSTCSILVEENECVIDYLLKKRPNARVIDTELPIGKEGFKAYRGWRFHPTLSHTRRFYPHVHNTDGFFVAKIKKVGLSPMEIEERKKHKESTRVQASPKKSSSNRRKKQKRSKSSL
ncbi:25S rRNA (cytosine2870-C5)-methyltransferase [Nematocida sp. AWRm77]|nr:25S rRNA (cytosine2870-C5)-methyltransferase [Nematocida sp. AWRm77]